MPPRTIVVSPTTPSSTLEYTLPPNVYQDVQAVLVEVDATGSGDVRPTLAVADGSGEVIARKRQGEPILGGGTGSATWARRLTDESPGGAGSAFTPQQEFFADPFFAGTVVPAGNAAPLAWTNPAGDVLLDLAAPTSPKVLADGIYALTVLAGVRDDTLGFVIGRALSLQLGTLAFSPLPFGVQGMMPWRTDFPVAQEIPLALTMGFRAGDALYAQGVNSQPAAARFVFGAQVVRLSDRYA